MKNNVLQSGILQKLISHTSIKYSWLAYEQLIRKDKNIANAKVKIEIFRVYKKSLPITITLLLLH